MFERNKTEREELYRDRDTQVFLSKFLSGETSRIDPVYDPKSGYRYPNVEAIVGSSSESEAFLDRLYQAGVLDRQLYDKVIYCPKCFSPDISTRYCCPYCKSFDIQKSSLVEHVKCGYMDIEENFSKSGKLACPKCHEELRKADVDYRQAGIWCSCKECGKSFDIPVSQHFCRNCHGNFTFEEVVIKDVFSYCLGKDVKQEASLGLVLVAPIRELLTKEGFEVESPAHLKGKSGANHSFDIVARGGGTKKSMMVLDLATAVDGVVTEQPVIALFAKIFDVSPEKSYLIAIPKMNDNGKKMAQLYSIEVIEAKSQKEATSALGQSISKKTSTLQ